MKVGLITFHAAYNFGSVLQAYATQEVIRSIAGNCQIINYRTKEQRRVYSIFSWNKGLYVLKSIIKNLLILLIYNKRKKRETLYEDFFNQYFELSEECIEPQDVYDMWNKYDLIVSGSDQIWNKHANELHHIEEEFMRPYLLYNYRGVKTSYASSFGNMSQNEIMNLLPYINDFSHISFREDKYRDQIIGFLGRKVKTVLDPTLLLNKKEWLERFGEIESDERYVLYYSLNCWRDIVNDGKNVKKLAAQKGLKVVMVLPMTPIKFELGVKYLDDVDPINFLHLVCNADTIITDSYHGTLFSVIFEKEFYSICGRNASDYRKTDILNRIGLTCRVITNTNEILKNCYEKINYEEVHSYLDPLIKESKDYLRKTLNVRKTTEQRSEANL